MRTLLFNPLVPLMGFTIGSAMCISIPLLLGQEISDNLSLIFSFGWGLLCVVWVMMDARRAHRTPCFDFPLLLTLFYPASIAWYCLWSRGWRGWGMLGLLTLLWIIPSVVAGIVLVVMDGDHL
jgi:hypothetical protein